MKKLNLQLHRLASWARNYYILVSSIFLLWIMFFDAEDVFTQYHLRQKKRQLELDKIYYQEQIKKIHLDKEALSINTNLLEKFAREKYYMRKPTEDLYIVDY